MLAVQRDPPPASDPPPAPKPLRVWRCCRCGALLARVWLPPGAVVQDVTCARCGTRQSQEAPAS